MKTMTRTALALLCLLPLSAPADEQVLPKQKYVYCTVCHGIAMGGNVVIAAPRLAGMDEWYVARQLEAFKLGWRGVHPDDAGGHEMRPMAAILSDEEIDEVSAYVAAVSAPPPPVTIEGNAERGAAIYASCGACHGADGQGNESLGGPPLTGLNDWYLETQLEHYVSGVRGSHPDDDYGQQMRAAAELLPNEQAIADVVRYISTLGSN